MSGSRPFRPLLYNWMSLSTYCSLLCREGTLSRNRLRVYDPRRLSSTLFTIHRNDPFLSKDRGLS